MCSRVHNICIRLSSNGHHRDICFFCFQIYFDDDDDAGRNELSVFFLPNTVVVVQIDVTVFILQKKK